MQLQEALTLSVVLVLGITPLLAYPILHFGQGYVEETLLEARRKYEFCWLMKLTDGRHRLLLAGPGRLLCGAHDLVLRSDHGDPSQGWLLNAGI